MGARLGPRPRRGGQVRQCGGSPYLSRAGQVGTGGDFGQRQRAAGSPAGPGQQDGTDRPALRLSSAETAPDSVLTLTTFSPWGMAPSTSEQLPAGARKTVAPASRAPIIFCWIPPMGWTAPAAVISPVPAMNLPSVRFSALILSMIPSANIMPALGPPIWPIWIVTLNGNWYWSCTTTPRMGLPSTTLAVSWTCWLVPPRLTVTVIGLAASALISVVSWLVPVTAFP